MLLNTRVGTGMVLLTIVLLTGALGYMIIEDWSFLDAFYMSVTTVTTVGFREVRELSTEGRVFTLFLILFGVGVAFYILTAMVAALVEGDLRQLFGERRLRMEIERLRDHFIVCGYGRVGEEIASELAERKAAFIVVDASPQAIERARSRGLLVVEGDAASEHALREAGIDRCHAVIAASDSDSVNTFITLNAKSLREDVTVVARVSTSAVEPKLRQAGASRVVSPYRIGGRRMAFAALQPSITDFIDLFGSDPQEGRILAEITVDEESRLAGKSLSEVLEGSRDVVLLAIRDADGRLSVGPGRSTVLSLGDGLILIGEERELQLARDHEPARRQDGATRQDAGSWLRRLTRGLRR